MSTLAYRRNSVQRSLGSYLAPASGYTVVVYKPGAQVNGTQPSVTAITVRAGHGVAAGDKVCLVSGGALTAGSVRTVSTVAATSVTVGVAISVTDGDYLVNIGTSDSGVNDPVWDGSEATIYSDMAGGTAISNSTVTTDSGGEYEYWTNLYETWEVILNGSTFLDLVPSSVGGIIVAGDKTHTIVLSGNAYPLGWTNGSGASGVFIDKPSTQAGASAVNFSRDGNARWSIGEDTTVGDRSHFALWGDKVDGTGGSWSTGDVLTISPAGSDTGRVSPAGVDACKWRFGSGMSPTVGDNEYDSAYQFEFVGGTLQASGEGMYSAFFRNSSDTINSGGMLIQVAGDRTGLQIRNSMTDKRMGKIELGASTLKSFYIGTDIPNANTQNFSIFDRTASAYRLYIDPSGNVAMGGTTSPTNALEVQKNSNAALSAAVINTTDGTLSKSLVQAIGNSSKSAVLAYFNPAYTTDPTVAGDAMVFASGTGVQLHLGTNGAKRVTIDAASAKVGIGVDPPTEALDVVGNIKLTSYVEGTEISAPGVAPANGFRLYAADNGAGKTQLIVIFASGAAQVLATEP